ncbi:hypothetical protein AURDEDRAFT_166254, partial [Auricularia subglabra TFB-10046 SS5]
MLLVGLLALGHSSLVLRAMVSPTQRLSTATASLKVELAAHLQPHIQLKARHDHNVPCAIDGLEPGLGFHNRRGAVALTTTLRPSPTCQRPRVLPGCPARDIWQPFAPNILVYEVLLSVRAAEIAVPRSLWTPRRRPRLPRSAAALLFTQPAGVPSAASRVRPVRILSASCMTSHIDPVVQVATGVPPREPSIAQPPRDRSRGAEVRGMRTRLSIAAADRSPARVSTVSRSRPYCESDEMLFACLWTSTAAAQTTSQRATRTPHPRLRARTTRTRSKPPSPTNGPRARRPPDRPARSLTPVSPSPRALVVDPVLTVKVSVIFRSALDSPPRPPAAESNAVQAAGQMPALTDRRHSRGSTPCFPRSPSARTMAEVRQRSFLRITSSVCPRLLTARPVLCPPPSSRAQRWGCVSGPAASTVSRRDGTSSNAVVMAARRPPAIIRQTIDFIVDTVPLVTFLVFGTSNDILRAWGVREADSERTTTATASTSATLTRKDTLGGPPPVPPKDEAYSMGGIASPSDWPPHSASPVTPSSARSRLAPPPPIGTPT